MLFSRWLLACTLLFFILEQQPPVLAVTLTTQAIGNVGNAADDTGLGGVGYEYNIGQLEVSNADYTEFLNAADPTGANLRGLYNSQMTSDARGGIEFNAANANGSKYTIKTGRANYPVVFVSFYDAARFTNWLHNGQGAGNTEDGAYQLTGGTPIPQNALFITRKVTATWCLPTLDEWYKAAYHKNDGVTGNYFEFPTASDTTPTSDQPPGSSSPNPSNVANFQFNDSIANGYNDGYAVTGSPALVNSTNYLTPGGAYTSADSAYGTFDQGGNVWEWTESELLEQRRVGGGSWINAPSFLAASSANNATTGDVESFTIGFRVVRVEPGVLPGDYNTNGIVDAGDYTVWRDTLGSTTDLRANGDNTGASQNVIDAADYDLWKSNFGQSAGSAALATPLPEPTTLALLVVTAIFSSCGPRRRLRFS